MTGTATILLFVGSFLLLFGLLYTLWTRRSIAKGGEANEREVLEPSPFCAADEDRIEHGSDQGTDRGEEGAPGAVVPESIRLSPHCPNGAVPDSIPFPGFPAGNDGDNWDAYYDDLQVAAEGLAQLMHGPASDQVPAALRKKSENELFGDDAKRSDGGEEEGIGPARSIPEEISADAIPEHDPALESESESEMDDEFVIRLPSNGPVPSETGRFPEASSAADEEGPAEEAGLTVVEESDARTTPEENSSLDETIVPRFAARGAAQPRNSIPAFIVAPDERSESEATGEDFSSNGEAVEKATEAGNLREETGEMPAESGLDLVEPDEESEDVASEAGDVPGEQKGDSLSVIVRSLGSGVGESIERIDAGLDSLERLVAELESSLAVFPPLHAEFIGGDSGEWEVRQAA